MAMVAFNYIIVGGGAGDLEGAPIEAYRSWQDEHTPGDRLPHGESIEEALRRYAGALQRLRLVSRWPPPAPGRPKCASAISAPGVH
jgi:hypothetical protein